MSLSLTGTWRRLSSVQAGRRRLFALSPLGVASFEGFGPARRARRRFGPSPFRRSGRARRQRDVPIGRNGQWEWQSPRRTGGTARAERRRGRRGPEARWLRGGAELARHRRRRGHSTGDRPRARRAPCCVDSWTVRIGSGDPAAPWPRAAGPVPCETPPHTENLSRVTCVGRSRRGKSADRPEAERAGPESARR